MAGKTALFAVELGCKMTNGGSGANEYRHTLYILIITNASSCRKRTEFVSAERTMVYLMVSEGVPVPRSCATSSLARALDQTFCFQFEKQKKEA